MSSYISYGANSAQNYLLINQEVLGTLSENISIYTSKLPIFLPSDSLYLKEIILISSSPSFDLDIELFSGFNLSTFSPIFSEQNISSLNGYVRKSPHSQVIIPNRLLFIKLKPNISCTDLSITLSLGF